MKGFEYQYHLNHVIKVATIEFNELLNDLSGKQLRFIQYAGIKAGNDGRIRFIFTSHRSRFEIPTFTIAEPDIETEINIACNEIWEHFEELRHEAEGFSILRNRKA